MADLFSHTDVSDLLRNKYVCFLGDSNIRAQYKDLVCLLTANSLLSQADLKIKGEPSFKGDSLVDRSELHKGRDYREVRNYYDESNNIDVDFIFITRVYNADLEHLFHDIKNGHRQVPDIIVLSSSIWDLNRWGPNGVPAYKSNMIKLMRLMKSSLPSECLVIWLAATPPSRSVQSAIFIKQIHFMQTILMYEIMEANWFARETVAMYGYDVIDCHYYMRMQRHRRAHDGLHYTPIPVRFISNLLLTHIALSWDVPLPGNAETLSLQKVIELESQPIKSPQDLDKKIMKNKQISNMMTPTVHTSPSKGMKMTFSARSRQNDSKRSYVYSEDPFPEEEDDPDRYLPTYWQLPYLDHVPGPTRQTKRKQNRFKRRNRGGYRYGQGGPYPRY